MKINKKKGKRYQIIITQLDLIILKNLDKNKEGFSVLELTKRLHLAPISLRRRLRWLEKLGLIHKNKVVGKYKFMVTISNNGKIVLDMFDKLLK